MPTNDNRFEREAKRIFGLMKLDYYEVGGQQIQRQSFQPSIAGPGHHDEWDGIILVGNTCIFVEVSEQTDDLNTKINKFVNRCELFRESPLTMRNRFAIFNGIPSNRRNRFAAVDDWRYLFIGTSPKLRSLDIRPANFPAARGKLMIFWAEEWAYTALLARSIGSFAAGELLASLDVKPDVAQLGLSHDGTIHAPFIKLGHRRLGGLIPPADLYATKISPLLLLTICRVPRFQQLPIILDSGGGNAVESGYQRLFNTDKLNKIRDHIGAHARGTFPNAITTVACGMQEKSPSGAVPYLDIPVKYASIDLIDGQHRLYSYASESIPQAVRRDTELMTTVINFPNSERSKVPKYSATLFITINQTQAKVKTELIYLTAYDAMQDGGPKAVAGKVLCCCADDKSHPLAGKLRVRPGLQLNRHDGVPTVPIVTLVHELAGLFDKEVVDTLLASGKSQFFRRLGCTEAQFRQRGGRVKAGTDVLKKYFILVKRNFSADFGSANSNLLCAKYLAAFIRLLRANLLDYQISWAQIEQELEDLAAAARVNAGEERLAFPSASDVVPSKKQSVKEIYEYLLAHCPGV